MHPVPTVLHRGGEIHPMHLYGTNVVWIKSNEANGNNKELILRLNQPLSARAQSIGETNIRDVEFLECRAVVICRGSTGREIYGTHVFRPIGEVDFPSEGSHDGDDFLDRADTATGLFPLWWLGYRRIVTDVV